MFTCDLNYGPVLLFVPVSCLRNISTQKEPVPYRHMKLTCLGGAPNTPYGSYLLKTNSTQLLLECPLDLSALLFFIPTLSPPQDENGDKLTPPFKAVAGHVLVDAEPWYKTSDLSHLDVSSIDAVLISSPQGLLGLPILTRMPEFSAKIYATSVTAKIGQLMMEELVSMHDEYVEIFGCFDRGYPNWLQPATLSAVSDGVRSALVGDDGVDRINWHSLYRKSDIKVCIGKIHCLHYGEEASINDSLIIRPCSSGSELGSSNWFISGAKGSLAYVTASVADTCHAQGFNLASLEGSDVILFTDLKSHNTKQALDNAQTNGNTRACNRSVSASAELVGSKSKRRKESNKGHMSELSQSGRKEIQDAFGSLAPQRDSFHVETTDKPSKVCETVIEAVKGGGSVLITLNGVGPMLELLEIISHQLQLSNLEHIPIFYVSAAAEETLAFANIIPEWLCASRQEKLYAGEALFGHVQLLLEKRLHWLSSLHTPELVNLWQEPCILFVTHWTLRMGPVVHLLHRWRDNPLCVLIMTEAFIDMDLALSPFNLVTMQILHYPMFQGLSLKDVTSTVQRLKPKTIMLPSTVKDSFEKVKMEIGATSVFFYEKDDTIHLPNLKEVKINMSADVALQIRPKQLENGKAVARMKMRLQLKDGKWFLEPPSYVEPFGAFSHSSSSHNECHLGRVEMDKLLKSLRERGLYCACVSTNDDSRNLTDNEKDGFTVVVTSPSPAKVNVRADGTFIETNDPTVRQLIADAVKSLLVVI